MAANVLLGVNQGLAWSMTPVMKIDLVGPRRRGLALGLYEPPATAASRSPPGSADGSPRSSPHEMS